MVFTVWRTNWADNQLAGASNGLATVVALGGWCVDWLGDYECCI